MDKKDVLDDDFVKCVGESLAIFKKASEICKIRGKTYEVECVCGGIAKAGKSTCNGHLHLRCDNCGLAIMQ